jgi:hypothetical protein
MEQRIEFVVRAGQGEAPLSVLCREYEVGQPTGYRRLRRYGEVDRGLGLAEKSRRPNWWRPHWIPAYAGTLSRCFLSG